MILLVAVVAVLVVIEPYVPTTFGFYSSDPVAQARYEEIVRAHGFEIRYEKNALGEAMAFVDGITPREYKTIDCEFFHWSVQRDRANGVIAYDRKDCAP